jgi:hypothetical protein
MHDQPLARDVGHLCAARRGEGRELVRQGSRGRGRRVGAWGRARLRQRVRVGAAVEGGVQVGAQRELELHERRVPPRERPLPRRLGLPPPQAPHREEPLAVRSPAAFAGLQQLRPRLALARAGSRRLQRRHGARACEQG